MLAYYFKLALCAALRSKALTSLIVLLMGVGVATCMTSYAVFRVASADPIPDKSSTLYFPQIDSVGPEQNNRGAPPDLLNYRDATALLNAAKGRKQTLMYTVKLAIIPDDQNKRPFSVAGDAVTSDFFGLFDAPFTYGRAWGRSSDVNRESVAVISGGLNNELFKGANSLGRTIVLDGHVFRIVGVLADFDPRPRYFEIAHSSRGFGRTGQIYIPFTRAIDMHKTSMGNSSCGDVGSTPDIPDWGAFLESDCTWISSWVQLDRKADAKSYLGFLRAYAAEQQSMGRYAWPPNVRLRNVMQWLEFKQVVPKESRLSLIVSLSFLVICLVNVTGLILAKFMRRANEICVRRALGASRGEIYKQLGSEIFAIGMAGGACGLVLLALGVASAKLIFEPGIASLVQVDIQLVALTLTLTIMSTFFAAMYPIWRAAKIQPAWQLKVGG